MHCCGHISFPSKTFLNRNISELFSPRSKQPSGFHLKFHWFSICIPVWFKPKNTVYISISQLSNCSQTLWVSVETIGIRSIAFHRRKTSSIQNTERKLIRKYFKKDESIKDWEYIPISHNLFFPNLYIY